MLESLIKKLPAIAIGILLLGCGVGPGGSNPSAPVVVPAELPGNFMNFPESIGNEFDFSQSPNPDTSLSKFIQVGDDLSSDISTSSDLSIFYTSLVDQLLAVLSPIDIPIGFDVIQFEDVTIIKEKFVNVKFDFSPYTTEILGFQADCSGNTQELPICFRIWFDDQRAIFGVFFTRPTRDNPGVGVIRGFSPLRIRNIDFFTSISYDIETDLQKVADIHFWLFQGLGPDGSVGFEPPFNEAEFFPTQHLLLSQTAMAGANFISTFLTGDIRLQSGEPIHLFKLLARWRDDDLLWSGSKEFEVPEQMQKQTEYLSACARIDTGLVVERQECLDAEIDIGEETPFLERTTIDDLAFPDESIFPKTPPF